MTTTLILLVFWDGHGADRGPKAGLKGERINDTAEACKAAATLIQGGYLKRSDLAGITVKAAREICARVVVHHVALDKMAKATGRLPRRSRRTRKSRQAAGL
jgi:hypothetical protein